MKLKFIWIGKTKDKSYQYLINEYAQRLKHYVKFDIFELKELKKKFPSTDEQKKVEGELLLSQLDKNDLVILLDEKGVEMNSHQLADFFKKNRLQAIPSVSLVIGGAFGFDNNIRSAAHLQISLSRFTFTHDMARLVLMEQVYRAFTILKGEKYHND